MIVNSIDLLIAAPIRDMLTSKSTHKGVSHGMSEAGYDIRIKQDIRFFPMGSVPGNDSDQVIVESSDSYTQDYGRFALASSVEKFEMPDNLVGIVHDKSTWARRGLSVFNTVIEPGWHGFLTLELVYHGNKPLHIPAGTGIAQVVFHKTACEARYDGKYQNQGNRPVEAIAS